MDNTSRSEKTRAAVIQAALTIISRDGASHLTLDAISKESGISKGGLLHQFPNKKAVLTALLEHQAAFYEDFSRRFREQHSAGGHSQPFLASQIATLRETLNEPNSRAFAVLAAAAQEPSFLDSIRDRSTQTLAAIRAEAADPQLAVLRWFAAQGVALSVLLGLCPLSSRERDQLFDSLLDVAQWSSRLVDTGAQDKPPRAKKSGPRGRAAPLRDGRRLGGALASARLDPNGAAQPTRSTGCPTFEASPDAALTAPGAGGSGDGCGIGGASRA